MIENSRIHRLFLVKDVIGPQQYCSAISWQIVRINIFSVLRFVDHTIGFSAAIFSFDSRAPKQGVRDAAMWTLIAKGWKRGSA
jgi:hypothetical protein